MPSTFSPTSPVVRVGIDIAKLTPPDTVGTPRWQAPPSAGCQHQNRDRPGRRHARRARVAVRDRVRGDRRLPSAARRRPRTGGLSSVPGFVHGCRPPTGGPVQLLGQERPEGRASHSASAEAGDDAARSRSAGDRASGPAGDGQHLLASLPAEGAAPAQPDHAPAAAVFSGGRAVSAQLPGRMVHRAAALRAVSGGRTSGHQDRVHRRGARAGHGAGRSTRRGGSPTSMRPPAAVWGYPWPTRRRRFGCFGSCARSIGRSASCASAWNWEIATRRATQPDFVRLQTRPGIGPIRAMTSSPRRVTCGASAAFGNFLK